MRPIEEIERDIDEVTGDLQIGTMRGPFTDLLVAELRKLREELDQAKKEAWDAK